MRLSFAVVMVVAFLPAVSAAAPTLNPQWGTIFPAGRAILLVHQCTRAEPGPVTGTWQPTPAQIAVLEAELGGLLATQLASRSDVGFLAGDYYRQYGGLIVGGRRIVYVNGFHRELIDAEIRTKMPATDWHAVPALVCDGGALTFGVEYDPATGTLAHFAFNGSI